MSAAEQAAKCLFLSLMHLYVDIKANITTQANGSALVEQGRTKVVSSVHGPRSGARLDFSESAVLQCEFKYARFCSESFQKQYARVSNGHDSCCFDLIGL